MLRAVSMDSTSVHLGVASQSVSSPTQHANQSIAHGGMPDNMPMCDAGGETTWGVLEGVTYVLLMAKSETMEVATTRRGKRDYSSLGTYQIRGICPHVGRE